jgi:predicted CXXCH cytochrome family protein
VAWAGGLVVAAVAVIVAWFLYSPGPAPPQPAASPPPGLDLPAAGFVGSEACNACHAPEHAAWQGSQHARAMQHATPATILGRFDGSTFSYAGIQSAFFRRDDRYFVTTDGPDGRLADFEVKYTFGVEPLQQYLVELPGGRLQALSLAWDTRPADAGGQRWFHLYPDEQIDFRDELHWTRRSQNWNFMCADCHSTDLRKAYSAEADAYATRYAAINVGCEACHGPASNHVAWARERPAVDGTKGLTVLLDERRAVSWAIDPATGNARRSAWRETEREIDVCAQCHARRAQLAEGYRAGAPFLDHYLPALLTPGLYHPDGQQRDEVYTWGSFLQSRMYQAGVTCSDCHDPHGQSLRAEGNAVCAQCHLPAKYAAQSHHHHDPASPAGQCVACHMPASTYMVVDPRRDHSLRIPRPDRTVTLGTPNACNGCHTDRDAAWAAGAARRWYGEPKPGFQSFAEAFHAAERAEPGAAVALARIVADVAGPPIARASALVRLATLGDPITTTVATRAAEDASPLLRLAAANAAGTAAPAGRVAILAPLLGDPLRAVRIEAARELAGVPAAALSPEQRLALAQATEEYAATLAYNADRPEARVALGTLRAAEGRYGEAQQVFAAATALDPAFVPAYLNAADAHRAAGEEAEARQQLEAGLARAPDNAALHHALGLALARQQQPDAALRALGRAVMLAPDDRRYAYVRGVALHSYGRTGDAIKELERAASRWPGDRDILTALATIQRDAGQLDAARRTARQLADAYPDDPAAGALRDELR